MKSIVGKIINAMMAAVREAFEAQRRRIFRRERIFRDHSQVLDTLTDIELISRYRFNRETLWELINTIENDVKLPTERGGHVIPPHIQVIELIGFFLSLNYSFRF